MKKILKKLFGAGFISKIRSIFPSKVQKELIKQEQAETKRRAEFYGSFIKKNELSFDVGANVGNRIDALLSIGARVVAVEPQEICNVFLKKKFGKKIEIVTKGLGEAEEIKDFHLSSGSPMSSFSEEWINSVKDGRFKGYTWDKVVKVEMTTLDKLIAQYGVPAFIKIDVEGYELNVLKGLSQPVKMLSFEYTVPELLEKPVACIEQIEKSNPHIECNYSIGETMEFAKTEWIPATAMKKYMLTDEFVKTGFGDVYVRSII
jgi:FkbM family methyltransferase